MNTQQTAKPNETKNESATTTEKQTALKDRRQDSAFERTVEPQVNVFEGTEAVTLVAFVPGAESGGIETEVKDNVLTVSAKIAPVPEEWKPIHREYAVGRYLRRFQLGEHIDQSKIAAELKDGVLTLTLPKAERAKVRRIEVRAA